MPKPHRKLPTNSGRPLTPQAERFVVEFLKDFNGTQAAIRAGYSRAGAHVRASELLRNLTVSNAIRAASERVFRSAQASVARVAHELTRYAFFDTACLFDKNGKLRLLEDLPPEARATLAGFELIDPGTGPGDPVMRRVRFGGKLPALIALARHLAMFTHRIGPDPDYVFPSDLLPSPEGRGVRGEVEGSDPDVDGDGHAEKIAISDLHDAIDEIERRKAAGDPEALALDEDDEIEPQSAELARHPEEPEATNGPACAGDPGALAADDDQDDPDSDGN